MQVQPRTRPASGFRKFAEEVPSTAAAAESGPKCYHVCRYPGPRSHWMDWQSDKYCLIHYDVNYIF